MRRSSLVFLHNSHTEFLGWYWNATTPKSSRLLLLLVGSKLMRTSLASRTIYHAAGGGIRSCALAPWSNVIYYILTTTTAIRLAAKMCRSALSHEWWVLKTSNPKEQKGLPYHSCPSMWGLLVLYCTMCIDHSLLDSFENQRMGSTTTLLLYT